MTSEGPADPPEEAGRLMSTYEVAVLFRVNPRTVSRWADAGLLNAIRTVGGRRRYRRREVLALASKRGDERDA